MTSPSATLPDISAVDFADPDRVLRYGALLVSDMQRTADLCTAARVDSPRAAEWLRRIERRLPVITTAYILRVMPLYDFIYRLVNGTAPDRRFLNRLYLRAFRAHVRRPNPADEPYLRDILTRRIRLEHDPDFLGAPLRYLTTQ